LERGAVVVDDLALRGERPRGPVGDVAVVVPAGAEAGDRRGEEEGDRQERRERAWGGRHRAAVSPSSPRRSSPSGAGAACPGEKEKRRPRSDPGRRLRWLRGQDLNL